MSLQFLHDKAVGLGTANWKDMKAPFIPALLDSNATNYDFDSSLLGISFHSDARYPNEIVRYIFQVNHDWKIGSDIDFHIHWFQSQAAIPNFLIQYRWYDNGTTSIPSWTNLYTPTQAFTYSSGTLLQISDFGTVSPTSISGVSSFIDVLFYRDTDDDSELFGAVDPVATDVTIKELDIHLQIDSIGSDEEYSKSF